MSYSNASYSQAPYSSEGGVVDPNVTVNVTGVEASNTDVGNLSVVIDVSITLTGVNATGSVGTVTVGEGVGVDLTGVENGQIRYAVSNNGSSNYVIDGASNPTLTLTRGLTYYFDVNASGHPFWLQTVAPPYSSGNVYNTGVTNNGAQVGTITFTVDFGAPDTLYYVCQYHSSMGGQINIVDQVGDVTVNLDFAVDVTGVEGTGQLGDETVEADGNVDATGVEGTGAVGTVSVPNVGVSLTGVEATGAVGTVAVDAGGNVTVNLTGVNGTGAVGTVSVPNVGFVLTGVAGTGAVGTVIAGDEPNVARPSGVEAIGGIGTVSVSEGVGINASGVAATGAIGDVTVDIVTPVNVTGVNGTGQIGNVTVQFRQDVLVSGVGAIGGIGDLTIWDPVDTDQSATWTNVIN